MASFLWTPNGHFTESPGWSMHMPQTPSKVTIHWPQGSRRKCIQPHLRMSPNICMMERTRATFRHRSTASLQLHRYIPVLLRPPPSPPSDHLPPTPFPPTPFPPPQAPHYVHAVSPPAVHTSHTQVLSTSPATTSGTTNAIIIY